MSYGLKNEQHREGFWSAEQMRKDTAAEGRVEAKV